MVPPSGSVLHRSRFTRAIALSARASSVVLIGLGILAAFQPGAFAVTPTPRPTPTPTPTPVVCIGDCDGDGAVTVNELVTMVNIALGNLPLSACPVPDTCVGSVCINSIIEAIKNALFGCPRLGHTCAGIAGLPCGPNEACDIHDATCAIADVGGICVPSGGACPEIFAPVCGCDGVTYANDCFRLLAGATLKQAGSCPSTTPTTTPVP